MCSKQPRSVILVDDSKFDNKLHQRVIERTGRVDQVLCFAMAEDALKHIRETGVPVELILLDINMPRMDGFEMLDAAISEHGSKFDPSVVVMLTTSMDPKDKERASNYEVIKDYFLKPLTSEGFDKLMAKLNGDNITKLN
jgi:CheY-like chemotaxis protein